MKNQFYCRAETLEFSSGDKVLVLLPVINLSIFCTAAGVRSNLKNSELLSNLDALLGHLAESNKEELKKLTLSFH